MTMTTQEKPATPAAECAAVLYVCVERSRSAPALAQERATSEGEAFADNHGLVLVDIITDTYGDPNPQARKGWQRVRAMAAHAEITTVIVRWPNAISPDHERRYPEIRHLQERGVQVLFSWAPLSKIGAEGR